MPPGIDFETAAAFTLTYGTSHHAVIDRGELKAGQTMLVLGAAGGVGLAAIEIGKAIGARVIAAASTDEKLAVCKEHGADAFINYSTEDLRERVKALTDGKGPDVIYDPVGGIYAEPAFRSIGWRGRYLVVGFANGEIPRLPLNLALLKGASLVGVFWGDFVRREPKANQANMAQMLGWMKEGKIRPHISARYPLEQAPQALKDMEARKVTGKIVIVPEGAESGGGQPGSPEKMRGARRAATPCARPKHPAPSCPPPVTAHTPAPGGGQCACPHPGPSPASGGGSKPASKADFRASPSPRSSAATSSAASRPCRPSSPAAAQTPSAPRCRRIRC